MKSRNSIEGAAIFVMTDEQLAPKRRWRPRFSLLSLLLTMALVASAITIWQMWQELGPLRVEVRSLRTDLGYLNIDDATKAQAIAVPTNEARRWKWRIYLPPGRDYRYFCYSGTLPSPQDFVGEAWFDRVSNGGNCTGSSGPMLSSEYTLEAWLEKKGDRWNLVTSGSGGHGGFGGSILQPTDDWLSSADGSLVSSGLGARNQTVFESGEPILLVKGLRPIVTKFPSGVSTRSAPQGVAEGFVLWIEENIASPPAGAKSQ